MEELDEELGDLEAAGVRSGSIGSRGSSRRSSACSGRRCSRGVSGCDGVGDLEIIPAGLLMDGSRKPVLGFLLGLGRSPDGEREG
jgi:hypothetical protein